MKLILASLLAMLSVGCRDDWPSETKVVSDKGVQIVFSDCEIGIGKYVKKGCRYYLLSSDGHYCIVRKSEWDSIEAGEIYASKFWNKEEKRL